MPARAASAARIRVLCVDDNEDIPEMLSRCIAAESDMESAGWLHSADDLVAEVARSRAHVVLLDLGMPGRDPIAAVRELAASRPAPASEAGTGGHGVRVIVYSGRSDQQELDRAINAGAWGYLSKGAEISIVLHAIREVARGHAVLGSP